MAQKRFLSEGDLKYCQNELNESKETEGCLPALREYAENQININTDDYNLLRFLRATKFDLEKAKSKMKCYYKLRRESDWFKGRNPNLETIDQLLQIGMFLPLLKRDKEGRSVVIVRATKHDPRIHTIDDVSKVGLMILDLLYDRFEDSSVYGVRAIFDLEGITLAHARQFGYSTIRTVVHIWQDCYPIRMKSIDCINSPSFMNVILNLFRSFMNDKIKSRVHIGDKTLLQDYFPMEILPEEYGGGGGKIEHLINYWRQAVKDNKEWYDQDETMCNNSE